MRIAHLSDLHVGHVSANLLRLGRLLRPETRGEGAWGIATRLLAASWFERRSLWEPLVRSVHLTHKYQTRSLVAVVQSAREHDCQHIILTGDVANLGAASEMLEAKLILTAFGYNQHNVTVVPGNHDVINFQGVGEFRSVMGESEWPHLKNIGEDIVVVALDSTVHRGILDWGDALLMNARGMLSEETVAKADALLASVAPDTFKIICCHHHLVDLPPDGYVEQWSGKIDPRQSGHAEGSQRLLDVAERRDVGLILFGHRHRATHHLFTIRGIPAACSGSVTETDSQGRLRYRIFDIKDARIRRRRWIDAFAKDASRDVVISALQGVSSARQEDDLTLTHPIRLRHIDRDMDAVLRKSKEQDRQVLEKVRKRMDSRSKE